MPLAPGFVHGFEVAPYVGKPFGSDFELGPRSEKIILNGDHIACDEVPELPAHVHPPPPPVVDPMHPHAFDKIRKLYDCGESSTPRGLGYADDEFRPGLLALTGTDICTDIFSSTPARFTWDSPAVHRVWGLVWIIAGSVLFTLLVWQGLRMTYDVWLDPQPSVGFRELVPRFLLAAALAASSLIICRMVLVAASDLTCFVAQSTGMSMWGVIGSTFGALVGGFTSWFQGVMVDPDVSFLQRLNNNVTLFFMGALVLIVLFFIIILFLKVLLSMLLRVALLAILIALSPLAFAFYASDATSHWTKKWVTLFLGTTFQQVVVLVVIYIGISIMDEYFGSGVESGVMGMLIGMLMAFATLSLATTIPDIVNPGGKGMFSGLGSMLTMAVAGGMMVASAGMGAVAGGAAAMGGGGGGAAGAAAAATGPATPAAGGGGASAAVPAATGGGPPSVGGGDNLISSVNRSSVGPAGGPSSGPSASPTSSGAGPSASTSAPGGGVALSSGSPAASASSGAPASSGGGPSAGARAGGILRGVGSGFMRGARRGQRFNTRMNDTMSGNAFYSHSSRSDDAAQQVRAQRQEQSEDRVQTRESYDRLSEVLDRIDDRL